jgi:tripartite-type tricarboxylate transporter receptor subunit TctC
MSLRPLALAVICSATAVATPPAAAQSVESFYRGKTVTMVIGYPPAGANDVYARMVARHIGKHIPGNPSGRASQYAGAGSLIAANHFNVAPRDGTVLSPPGSDVAAGRALGAAAVKFKSAGFHWIGRMAGAPNITFINTSSAVKSIADAFDKTAILGATGRSATNAIYPTVLNNVLGTKFKVVTGYQGQRPPCSLAERGEVEGHSATYDSLKTVHADWLTQKRVNVVVQ